MNDNEKYMEIALQQAREALSHGEFPVGCVIVYQEKIVATGKRRNSFGKVNELDHAEILAIRSLLDSDRKVDIGEVTIYSTMEPCLMCFSTLLVNGVRKFVYSYEDAMGGGTNIPRKLLSPLYRDLDVQIIKGVLRDKSLAMFRAFFSSSRNRYLKNSLLAEYTLQQQL